MKKYILWYYLLFMLLIMGTFASMAQNAYGNVLLGCVGFAFAFLFLIQLVASLSASVPDRISQLELLSLTIIAFLLGLRVFYIRFVGVEFLYAGAAVVLMLVYLKRLVDQRREYGEENRILTWLLVLFHMSVIIYILSMTLVPFAPTVATSAGEIAFAFLIIFLIVGFLNRNLTVEGETVSAWHVISRWNNQSVIVIGLFALFTAYLGLTQFDAMPRMHSDEMPNAYFELLRKAEGEPGQRKAEAFKVSYDRLVDHEDKREQQ